jgi:hypothetical protein
MRSLSTRYPFSSPFSATDPLTSDCRLLACPREAPTNVKIIRHLTEGAFRLQD